MKKQIPFLTFFSTTLAMVIIMFVPTISFGQTVFSDDFTTSQGTTYTTATGPIGTSTVWSMNTAGSAYGAKIDGGILNLANVSLATGAIYTYTPTTSFASPYNTTLGLNTGVVTWTFNIRQIRTDPSGWGTGSYAAAVILASSSSNALTTGTGYAITYGVSGSTDPMYLIRYTGGIRAGTRTTLITSTTVGLTDFGADYISVKVTFIPSTNTWEMFIRNDGSSAFTDPSIGTLTSQGTLVDNTYTGTALNYMGAGWNGSASANQTAFFDNFKVTLPSSSLMPPTLIADITNNDVDNNIDIAFIDDAIWRTAITSVKIDGTALTATTDYDISSGNLQLKPSGLNALLTTSGSKSITVEATGYNNASVIQIINPGAPAKLAMNTQPTAPATNGGVLAIQPSVNILDQYGNATTSTANVLATVGAGVWTLGGTVSVAGISGTTTYSGLTASANAAVTSATIAFSSSGLTGVTSNTFNIPSPPPPTLTAAIGATVDAPFNITFIDNPTWRASITSITIDGTPLTAGFSNSTGIITLTPSLSVPTNLLQISGTKTVVISASGYSNATVSQPIGAGIAAKLAINTQPTAPTTNGGVLDIQPSVNIQDQYGNATTSTANVLAAVGAGVWTLGGTVSVAGISGTTTYSGLTATANAAVTGATITFSSSGLTGITSNPFNIPSPPPLILNAALGATVDAPFNITFIDNPTWRASITSITINGTILSAGYSISNGLITLTPSLSSPANLLQISGTKTIVVTASSYSDASVSQFVGAGIAAKLAMNTQPTAPATNGGVLAIQPSVNIQDQYGNATTSTATVLAAVGAGVWTLGGTVSVAGVSGTTTYSGLTATANAAVTGAIIAFSSSGLIGVTSNTFNIPSPPPPTLTAAIGATVDAPFNITFIDNPTWRAAITGITINGTSLTAGFSNSTGIITFTPSLSNPANLLQISGTKTIVVSATGYTNATVSQPISAGIAAKLAMNTQPTAPATNGGVLTIQPSVKIQDQYGNATTSTASVLAVVGAGVWTLGGTVSVAGVSGTTTYSGLTASAITAVTGATIIFSSSGLTGITSAPFNIPLFMSAPSAPTNLTFASVTYNSFTSSFTAPTIAPSGYLVLRNTGSAVSGTPIVGNEYLLGQTNIGFGTNEVVYNGSSAWTNYPQTGLTNSTAYYYSVYSYNGSGVSTIYSTALTGNQTTAGVPVLSIATITNVTCYSGNDGIITLNPATGGSGTGYEYAMRNPALTGTWSAWQSGLTFNNLSFSSYGFKTKDGTGNESVEIVANISQMPLLTGTVRTANPLCYGSGTGTISINGTSGGNGNYQFSVNGGGAWQTSPIFNNLNAGIYDVWIKDGNSCTRDLDGIINTTLANPILLEFDTVFSANVSECFGNNNASINIVATGGNGTKLYSINNGTNWQISNSFTLLTAGNYIIKLKDITCELIYAYNPIIISEPLQLNADITTTNPTTANNGIIQVGNLTGGSGVYQVWITGSTWQTAPYSFTGLTAGTYTIKIRDANNITCEKTLSSNTILIPLNGIDNNSGDNCISFIDNYIIINKYKNSNILICNTIGQQLYNKTKTDDGTLKININDYLTGYYIIKINTDNVFIIKKFFKK